MRALTAKNAVGVLTRKEVDKLTEFVRGIGAKGLAWVRWTEENIASSFGKFLTEEEMTRLLTAAGAEKGDVVLIVADTVKKHVLTTLGALRVELANKLSIEKKGLGLLWITAFPSSSGTRRASSTSPCTIPSPRRWTSASPISTARPDKVYAKAYDLVLAGVELASGSIRITDPELQGRMFRALGLSDEEAHEKFGFLTDAFQYGAPPHGGHGHRAGPAGDADAGGRDPAGRSGFPQGAEHDRAHDGCPSPVDAEQLTELGLQACAKEE